MRKLLFLKMKMQHRAKTFKFCCQNAKCESAWQDFHLSMTQEESDKGVNCELCGEIAKRLGVLPFGGHLRVGSMTPQQKQQVLKQRSKEHSKKNISTFHEKNRKDYKP